MPKSKKRKRGSRTGSKSGFFGVVERGKSGRYRPRIQINGKLTYLGTAYDTAKQAAQEYDQEAIRLRRPLSKLNFPKTAPVGYTPIQQPLRSNNTIGYRGVQGNRNKYQAIARVAGKRTSFGTYYTSKEAAIAYDRAVLQANQSTSLLNFPDMVHNFDVELKRKTQKVRSPTGYRGVSKTPSGRFATAINTTGKKRSLGTYDTAIQAALAYDQAAIKAGRKKSTLNFPDGLPIKQESDLDDSEGFWV